MHPGGKSNLRRYQCSRYLQLILVISLGLLFLTHFGISIYLTIAYKSFNSTLCSLSLTLFLVIWMICFIIISCLLLQYFQADIINVLSRETRDRSNICFLLIILFYYCSFGLIVIIIIPTFLPLTTTFFCIYYYHSAFILNQYGIKQEWFVCSIAYHLALMIPQFIIQCIFYQTTMVNNDNIHILHWSNSIIFMFYIILVSIIFVINKCHFTAIYYSASYSKSLLITTQIKFHLITIILELTLIFYFIFMVQILNVNISIFYQFELTYSIIPISNIVTKSIGCLCGNYFILSVPFSILGIVNYYFNKSKNTYSEIWSQCVEVCGYETVAMFDKIYCINHICYHKHVQHQTLSANPTSNSDSHRNINETTKILPHSSNSNMNKHYECDQICLNYQRKYLQNNGRDNGSGKKAYRKSVILALFGHVSPIDRMRKWMHKKISVRHGKNGMIKCFVINLKRILIIIYIVSRIISVLLTVIICNWFLFSYYIDIENDNVALNVMRMIGIFYVLMLMIWIYYLMRIYYFEYMVGYIIKTMDDDISYFHGDKERMKRVESFENIMITNYLINKYVGYSDIASLICLYLFYPYRHQQSILKGLTIIK